MQEQEQRSGQEPEREYNYDSGPLYDPSTHWEKVTSYSSPKQSFFPKGRSILGMLTLFVVVAASISWVLIHQAVVTPLLDKRIPVATVIPTIVTTPATVAGAATYTYHGHSNSVYDVAWSSNSSRVASASEDGTVQVWDATTGTNVVVHRGKVSSFSTLAWSPNGKYIVSASASDPTIDVWDALTGKTTATYQLQGPVANIPHNGALSMLSGGCNTGVYEVAWSPDGTRLIAAGGYLTQGIIEIFDVKTGSRLLTYTAHPSCVDALSWSPNGQYIASGSFDGTLNVWNATTGHTAYAYPTAAGTNVNINSLVWSPDGQRIAISTTQQGIHVWDPFHGQTMSFDAGQDVFGLAWSHDGQRIATSSPNPTITLLDAHTGATLSSYNSNSNEVFAVAWSPNGQLLASANIDDTVSVWRV